MTKCTCPDIKIDIRPCTYCRHRAAEIAASSLKRPTLPVDDASRATRPNDSSPEH